MSDQSMIVFVATYPSVEDAEVDRRAVMQLHKAGDLGHVAASVLHKEPNGKLKMDRHDTTAKHLAWGGVAMGAFLGVIAPPIGLAFLTGGLAAGMVVDATVLAGVGGLSGHFWKNIPKDDLRAFGATLEAGNAALVVVAVDRDLAEIEGVATRASGSVAKRYEQGDLQGAYDEAVDELAKAR